MKSRKIIFCQTLLTLCLGMSACDAPRQNPFDPQSDNYIDIMITNIKVLRLYPPNEGVGNINVILDNIKLFGTTNTSGIVEWEHDPVDSLIVVTQGMGYFPDTLTFSTNFQNNQWNVFINAIPQIENDKIFSTRDNSSNLTYVSIEAEITDPDGPTDISTAYLTLEENTFTDTLNFDNQLNRYFAQFNINKLPGGIGAEELPELTFYLVVKNISGDSLISSKYSIVRVIIEDLQPLSPNISEPASGAINFKWGKVNLNYVHYYYVLLFRLDGNVQRIGKFGPFPSDQNYFDLDDPEILNELASGLYLWLLHVEDQPGNISQSNAVNFQYNQ